MTLKKTWTTRLKLTYLIWHYFIHFPPITCRQTEHVFVASLGENTGKLVPGFYWTSPPEPLPFNNFNLYHFTVINYNQDTTAFSSLLIWGHLLSLWMILETANITGFEY